jgi:hypothetical protein
MSSSLIIEWLMFVRCCSLPLLIVARISAQTGYRFFLEEEEEEEEETDKIEEEMEQIPCLTVCDKQDLANNYVAHGHILIIYLYFSSALFFVCIVSFLLCTIFFLKLKL